MSTELFDELEAGELSVEFEGEEPETVLEWALERFDRIAISTAFQVDGCVLIDMAARIRPDVRVFSVDTGRLPQETHDLADAIRARYPELRLELLSPDAQQLQGLDAWISGLRRDQWATRTNIRKVEIDHDHDAIVKLNPLAEWTEDEVWDYVRENDVPTHALYERGYTSIGCGPCTRAIAPGEAARAGRWWWESGAPKECGIHCAIETGGFEHELHAIVGGESHE